MDRVRHGCNTSLPELVRRSIALEGREGSDQQPVLLLHGYTDSWRSCEPLLAELPLSLRAIALSQQRDALH
jgi:hypothetical protein